MMTCVGGRAGAGIAREAAARHRTSAARARRTRRRPPRALAAAARAVVRANVGARDAGERVRGEEENRGGDARARVLSLIHI